MLSSDARIAFRPEATYLELIARPAPPAWRALGRPLLVLAVIAIGLPVAAAHDVTARLVLTTAAAWSPLVLIQAATGAALIASAPARRVGVVRALDLWFAAHLPYSFWILALPALAAVPIATPHELMAASLAAPLAWTAVIVAAYCRTVLGATPAGARQRAAVHLAVVIAIGSALVLWAAGGWAALVSYLLRRLTAA